MSAGNISVYVQYFASVSSATVFSFSRGLELTRAQLTDWYGYRAREIEKLSCQVDHALDFVRLAMERYVQVSFESGYVAPTLRCIATWLALYLRNLIELLIKLRLEGLTCTGIHLVILMQQW